MEKMISARGAANLLIGALAILVVFHVLVLLGIVPAQIVWSRRGAIEPSDLIILEAFALSTTFLFLLVVFAKTGYLRVGRFIKIVNVGLWIILFYLLLNIGANLISEDPTEKFILAPLTILMILLVYRLILDR